MCLELNLRSKSMHCIVERGIIENTNGLEIVIYLHNFNLNINILCCVHSIYRTLLPENCSQNVLFGPFGKSLVTNI